MLMLLSVSLLNLSQEVRIMAKIFYKRIVAGEMTLEEVPALWRTKVEKLINKEERHYEFWTGNRSTETG